MKKIITLLLVSICALTTIASPMPGSHIIIELGGKIIHSKVTPFEIPLGSILDITDGSLQ